MDEKVELVVDVLRGATVSEAARAHGVCRKTAHKWLRIYREAGRFAALAERSRRPHRSPQRTSAAVEARVRELRKTSGWGGRKISRVLARDEGILVSPATVDRVLERQGLTDVGERHTPAPTRFQRSVANELWQIDHKAPIALADGRRLTPFSILDDYSRFLIGLTAQGSTSHAETEPNLRTAFEKYGLPEAMLMDHGVPWWSATSGHGLTRFSVLLIEQGITVIYGAVNHPQTQGKVERLHGSLARALRHRGSVGNRAALDTELARFRHEYNEVRPHESLGMDVPAARYSSSSRRYCPRPEPWQYPIGSEVCRVNSAGLIDLPSQRHFVCHALAGKEVWCRRFGSRLLVTYRHMNVREIDLETGVSYAVVKPWYSPDV
jgi:transposase InsO family protein